MSGFTRSHTDMERINAIMSILRSSYPHARIALHYKNPWELLVSVILSAQCTDVMVNRVTELLFRKYPTLESYVTADLKEFEADIHKTGFFRNKAQHILKAAVIIKETYKGMIPKTMDGILTIPGVARKTANVVLGNAYGIVEGIAVDTHVIRLSQRLRFVHSETIGGKHPVLFDMKNTTMTDYVKDADPVKIENELMALFPRDEWFPLTYRLIDHGRAVCKAQHPNCSMCPLVSYCPVSRP
jgi:endonuclease III